MRSIFLESWAIRELQQRYAQGYKGTRFILADNNNDKSADNNAEAIRLSVFDPEQFIENAKQTEHANLYDVTTQEQEEKALDQEKAF